MTDQLGQDGFVHTHVSSATEADFDPRLPARHRMSRFFQFACLMSISLAILSLAVLLIDVVLDGYANLTWTFLSSYPSRLAARAGILSPLVGTVYVMGLTGLFSFPVGLGAAIFLEEYVPRTRMSRFLEINIANLAGVPSIIYGLLGLGLFVRQLQLGRSLLAGALTLGLLILPVIIVSAREAIKAVPNSQREAAYALGATKWQMVRTTVLPIALPGVLTGNILAFSRAIGETAPLITIGALTFIAFTPRGVLDTFTVLPIQIFNWVSRPQPSFHALAASAILVLLVVLLGMNAVAIWLRNRLQKRTNW